MEGGRGSSGVVWPYDMAGLLASSSIILLLSPYSCAWPVCLPPSSESEGEESFPRGPVPNLVRPTRERLERRAGKCRCREGAESFVSDIFAVIVVVVVECYKRCIQQDSSIVVALYSTRYRRLSSDPGLARVQHSCLLF